MPPRPRSAAWSPSADRAPPRNNWPVSRMPMRCAVIVEPPTKRERTRPQRESLNGCGYCTGSLGIGAGMVEEGGAPRGDGKTNLLERQREGHLRVRVVFFVLALVDHRDHE